jgi:O-antigen/teichoic acid export membrane protein
MGPNKEISAKGLIKNSRLLLLGNVIGKLSALILIPIYSWLISPSDFGVIFTIQTIGSLLMLVVPLSVDVAISRLFFDQESEKEVKVMYSSVLLSLTLSTFLIYSVLYYFSDSLSSYLVLSKDLYLKLCFAYCFFGQFFPVASSLLLAQGKVRGVALSVISSNFILVVANVIFVVYLKDKVLGYIISYVIFYISQFVLFFVISKKYFIKEYSLSKVKEVYSYSIQFLLTNVSSWIVALCDRLMLLKMKGASAVGLYSTGYSIASAPNVLVNSINQAFAPYSYSAFKSMKKEKMNELSEVMTTLFVGYTLLFFGVIFFVNDLVVLLGPKYRDTSVVIQIVVFAYYFNALKLIVHNPMSFITGMVKYKSIIWVITALINIGFNLYLIPLYSYNGAGIATLISFGVTLLPIYFLSQKAIHIEINLLIVAKVFVIVSILFLGQYFAFLQVLWIKVILFGIVSFFVVSQVPMMKVKIGEIFKKIF